MVPKFLRCSFDGSPLKDQTVVCNNVRFTIITSRLIRVEQGNFYDSASQAVLNRSFEKPDFERNEKDGVLCIKTEHLTLSYKLGEILSGESLTISLNNKPFTRWHYGEKPVHNLGGTVSTLDRVSGSCELKGGLCSLEGYEILDDSKTALFTDDGWFEKRNNCIVDMYFFGYGHDYIACIRDYCRLTGIPKMLPSYALGNWWSRYNRYSENSYLELMDKFSQKDIPLSVAVIDMDWHITEGCDEHWNTANAMDRWSLGVFVGWTGYTWNNDLFPDYKRFLNELHKRNLKTSLNLHPSGGVRYWEEQYADMAMAMGVDPESRQTIPFDCLNPKFVDNYFKILHYPFEDNGVDFWWMDWQQGFDYNWTHQFGIEKSELEIISPLWMLNHLHYKSAERKGNRGLILSRFSGYGSHRYPIGFSGDTYATWESLDFQPYFTATASNVGYGWWSHDIGGHLEGDRDDELTIRWIQFGVFSPIFRLHSCDNMFCGREPWNYGKEYENIAADFMRLRHSMFPYLYTMNYRNFKEQVPLMLPMYYTHPEEKRAYEVKNQYWFGSELIVTPITKKADNKSRLGYSEVWLPEGKWIDWFNGYIYKGDESFQCFRAIDQMPIFIKAGGIIPMQKHKDYQNTLGNSDELQIVIAAGANGQFTMFEDDGESNDYENGDGAFTRFNFLWDETTAEFSIEQVYGNLELIPKTRQYTLVFKGFREGCEFLSNGKTLSYTYDPETNSYSVYVGFVEATSSLCITVKNSIGLMHCNNDYLERCYKLLINSQESTAVRNNLFDLAKEMQTEIKWRPEPVGENMAPKAIYELALQNLPNLEFDF